MGLLMPTMTTALSAASKGLASVLTNTNPMMYIAWVVRLVHKRQQKLPTHEELT